ncbi:hypothetical protein P3415_003324 [Pseudomonas aeruginosa]|uniref:hypothetical protein n=1 Tax=Pseudomonas aeruginosa TaxID=287 RepID=UPI00053EE345|nr:hypothetical protein [Pseudomonas aeruginosa]EKS2406543.1 hypothetical protein [Pseudomonas aeruginosa]EKW2498584.1 hypothetical protein [Pseudomonas aeruginosa]EKX4040677.1 hypothetical protein [Pseudomonas aeruginosa]ELQ8117638.1 hypothetical protein [Pseudomonas aeruginosa]ELS0721782.1 hypothetical protein [Pseudomonas aeruginosa]
MADALRPLAWATIYSHPGRKDIVEIGDADPVRERDAETWGWRHRRVQLVEIPAGHVVVPRELLEELLEAAKDGAAHKGEYLSKKYGEPELFAKFDTLLQS